MNLLASLSIAFIIAMSPAAKAAFSEISEAQILFGTMEFQGSETVIEAVGRRGGVLWNVRCLWKYGMPVYINFESGANQV